MSGVSHVKAIVITLGLAAGILPVVLYYFVFLRVPSVTPTEARELLAKTDSSTLLVDIRDKESFDRQHIAGAVNWPMSEIETTKSLQQLPSTLQGKQLLLLCDSGHLSTWAVRTLAKAGITDVFSVKGGVVACTMDGRQPCPFDVVRALFVGEATAPVRESPLHEQIALVSTGFGIKPIYMTMSFVLALILWRSKSPDLVALRWGMIFFFLGEAACAFNYLVFNLQSHFTEYLHSFGMALAFSFVGYAVFEGIDLRLIHYSDMTNRCAALGLCKTCHKKADGPCGLERLFLWLSASLFVVAFMPLCAGLYPVSYNTNIFGTDYNFSHPVVYQLFEFRYCPIVAAIAFGAAFVLLALKKENAVAQAKIAFAAGTGPLGFSFFRLLVFQVYRDDLVWFDFWEETTEFVFIVGVALVLWLFRTTLFAQPA